MVSKLVSRNLSERNIENIPLHGALSVSFRVNAGSKIRAWTSGI